MREQKIFKLENVIQNYSWGTKNALYKLFGTKNPNNKPQAEIWMGAHPKAPSTVLIDNSTKISLIDFIEKDPPSVLGSRVNTNFGGKLPFLFKVLSAGAPLSIQAHPNMKQAKRGFKKENRAGIDISAPDRNYKDDNHKPELICAVTPFKAFKGFRKISELTRLLEELNIPILEKKLNKLKMNPTRKSLKEYYSWMMKIEGAEKDDLIYQAVDYAKNKQDNPPFKELLNLYSYYSNDIGIMCSIMLNLIVLQPGEAMYLDAGELHAYIDGTGMEIMANSDNVLRGGLTPKHVDLDELLSILSFNAGNVMILNPVSTGKDCESVYTTPAKEFALNVITVAGNEFVSNKNRSVEILFCEKGSGLISVIGKEDSIELAPGESYLVPAGVPQYKISGNTSVFKGTAP